MVSGQTTRPLVWTIAGSDSGGGAGIQADLLSIHDLSGHGCSVVTTLTAQNSQSVRALAAVDQTLFEQQLDALSDDLPAVSIKIGLLGNEAQILSLVRRLPEWRRHRPGLKVVLDPVLVATSGDRLAAVSLISAMANLLPLVDLVTPNGDELAALTGKRLMSADQAWQAGAELAREYGTAVLVKGGHFRQEDVAEDRLFTTNSQWSLCQPWIDSPHTHGTGCTLSAAWAVAVAQGYPLEDAVVIANAYVQAGLRCAYQTGQGAGSLGRCGWPDAQCFASMPLTGFASRPKFAPLEQPLGIYPVVDEVPLLEALLKAGATTVQLRLKHWPDNSERQSALIKAIELGRAYGAQVVINDYWREAIERGAWGVHLGQEDLLEADLEAIANAGLRLGVSTHGYAELGRALSLNPSYIALGHVFGTQTKIMPSEPQGLERLQRYQARVAGQCPTVAIGGIKGHHLPAIATCGVDSVAVVTAITHADEPVAAWQELQQHWSRLTREAPPC